MIRLAVNGELFELDVSPDTPLLYVLRNDIGLSSPKFGCGLSQCGACTVLVNGEAIRSCITPTGSIGDKKVVTLEGLGAPESPHPLQEAFIRHQAMQCGYCANGMIMTAAGLLDRQPDASPNDIRIALSANICRCSAHARILAAIEDAAREMANDPA